MATSVSATCGDIAQGGLRLGELIATFHVSVRTLAHNCGQNR